MRWLVEETSTDCCYVWGREAVDVAPAYEEHVAKGCQLMDDAGRTESQRREHVIRE
jgi:hypothetical protein